MPNTLGSNFHDVFAVDTFISPSKELAILTRKDILEPRSISLVMPATEKYADLQRWTEKHPAASIPIAFENLLQRKCDSALVYSEYAQKYPDRVRLDQAVGSPDDVWIVYGTERTSQGRLLAWRESPLGRRFRQLTTGKKEQKMNICTEGLEPFRNQINDLDEQITNLLARRFEVCAEVARYKKSHDIPMMQPDRVEAVKQRCAELGVKKGLRSQFVREIYSRIIQEACDLEDEIIGHRTTSSK